jgi:hypothetical protein
MCLQSRCLAMNAYSYFTISAFGRHVTILIIINFYSQILKPWPYKSQDGRGLSIVILVVLSIIFQMFGNVKPILEGGPFPIFSNYFFYFIAVMFYKFHNSLHTQLFNSGVLGFWTLSIIRYSKEHISETGSVSVLTLRWLMLALSKGLNRVGVSHPLTWRKLIQLSSHVL